MHYKQIIGIILSQTAIVSDSHRAIEKTFGPIESVSDCFDYSHSAYYSSEMGPNLKKQFLSIAPLKSTQTLAEQKILSQHLENNYRSNDKRQINIDPGAIFLHNLILLSTKNFSHRIPLPIPDETIIPNQLSKNPTYKTTLKTQIFAETTLLFKQNKIETLPWTYPDFIQSEYHSFLFQCRSQLKKQLAQFDADTQTHQTD